MATSIVRRAAAEKLSLLRSALRAANLHAYVVPTSDAHNSEYVSEHDKRRAYLSGFTGSAGTAVITETEARLWTDGRYFSQALHQLDSDAGGWVLMKDRLPETPSIEEFLLNTLKRGQRVGCDPRLFSVSAIRRMQQMLKAGDIAVHASAQDPNLIDQLWSSDPAEPQPGLPNAAVMPHPVKHAGKSHIEKLAEVRDVLRKEGASMLIVTALDEIAWLFNIRGGDVACNPVAISYAIVTVEGAAYLCIDSSKISADVVAHLGGEDVVKIIPYDAVADTLLSLPGKAWLDPSSCNYAIYEAAVALPASLDKDKPVTITPITTTVTPPSSSAAVSTTETAPLAAETTKEAENKSSSNASAAVSNQITTPYGTGPILSRRAEDGFLHVQLPYGVAFIHEIQPPQQQSEKAASPPPAVVAEEQKAVETNISETSAATTRFSSPFSSHTTQRNRISTTLKRMLVEKPSPITLMKAFKNTAEIEGIRAAHLRDGVALVTFLAWLEAAVTRGLDTRIGKPLDAALLPLTEFSVGQVLDDMRAKVQDFVSLSFETIAGFGPNGAVIHYRAEQETAAKLDTNGVFLLDSGGQYRDGTTDVTRTVHFGTPSAHEKTAYTAVLQGHIALSSARFPKGTSGIALDAFARSALWQLGLDYRHGTGHGVGAFLNVHEGPQYIANAVRSAWYNGGIQESMTITDEPGYYEDGAFGIRIENVLVARAAATPFSFGNTNPASTSTTSTTSSSSSTSDAQPANKTGYLEFEPLTQVPISTKLVDVSMLSPKERKWLNDYNQGVRVKLAPFLRGYALEYLLKETFPV